MKEDWNRIETSTAILAYCFDSRGYAHAAKAQRKLRNILQSSAIATRQVPTLGKPRRRWHDNTKIEIK
jgi:hypothetical protein